MTFRCIITLLTVLAAVSLRITAGEVIDLKERRYDVQTGLPSNEVNSFVQDDRGFVWMATTNGLARFDGYDFSSFRASYDAPDFFRSNTIVDIAVDGAKIWLVTPKGLECFNQETRLCTAVQDSLLDAASLKTVLVAGPGKILAAGLSGVFLYDEETGAVKRMKVAGDESLGNVRTLYKDRYGNVWIGAWGKGIYQIPNGSDFIRPYVHQDIDNTLTVNDFAETADGDLLIGTWGKGLMCLRHSFSGSPSLVSYAISESRPHHLDWNIVYSVETDSRGYIYAGSPRGIRIFSMSGGQFVEHGYRMSDERTTSRINEVKAVFRDSYGNVWLSDYGRGTLLMKATDSGVDELDLRHLGLSSSTILAVYRQPDGIIWLGVSGQGIIRYDENNGKVLNDPLLERINPRCNAGVAFIPLEKKNAMIAATRYDGVFKITLSGRNVIATEHIRTNLPGVRNLTTTTAAVDMSETIWVGTRSGIIAVRPIPETGKYVKEEPEDINRELGYATVSCICPDLDGNLWIGTSEFGIFKVNDDSKKESDIRKYCVENGGLNSNNPLCIFQDRKGRIWAGTKGGGLSLYEKESDKFHIIENMNLFLSDEICSITEDKSGNLWLSSSNGFTCCKYDSPGREVINYGATDGLSNISFLPNSVWTDGRRIIYGAYEGMSSFSINSLPERRAAAKPMITDIQIYGNPQTGVASHSESRAMPPYTGSLNLDWKDKSLAVTFASPDFANSDFIRYAYRMTGIDKDWHYTTSANRTVIYSNLSPGRYIFSVKASCSSGEWIISDPLHIRVTPAPFFSWWAILLYVLAGLVIAFIVIYSIVHRVRLRHRLRIEQMERLKSEEVNNAKLVFFTNVSHELFTPLTVMSVSIEKLLENFDDPSLSRILRSNLDRLKRLLQQIMEFRKAESSNLRLKVANTDIVSFVKKICDENFAPLIDSGKNVNMLFSSDTEHFEGYIDRDKLDKILYNLISNAYKYNRPGGSVSVSVKTEEAPAHYVIISVKDTGYGISSKKQAGLFKRFYEGDYREYNTTGTGIGLSLTKDLVDLHKGTIRVDSIEGEGTEFQVRIPVDRSAYSDDQIQTEVILDDAKMTISQGDEAVSGDKNSVLVVEDNEELLYMMKRILSGKYNVFTAKNGKEALEVLGECPVDIVITDLLMPEMDGADLCRAIRSDLSYSHLPVIVLSARTTAETKMESFEAGADAYIAKPFDMNVLIAQVDGLIQNRKKIFDNFRQEQTLDTGGIISTDLDRQFIDRAVNIIESHISETEFNINDFNQAMNMSNSTLYRKIKGLTGMSPKEFIRNIRFKYACRLLLEKSSSVAEVAYMVGFSDAKYFSICFKKEFGMTPSKYISIHRKDETTEI